MNYISVWEISVLGHFSPTSFGSQTFLGHKLSNLQAVLFQIVDGRKMSWTEKSKDQNVL